MLVVVVCSLLVSRLDIQTAVSNLFFDGNVSIGSRPLTRCGDCHRTLGDVETRVVADVGCTRIVLTSTARRHGVRRGIDIYEPKVQA